MSSGLIRSLFIACLAATVNTQWESVNAAGAEPALPAIVQRFLSLDDPSPTGYRALRHMDARNDKFKSTAWMDVWTEADSTSGFKYTIVGEGGSDYIRSKVFMASLDAERKMYLSGAPDRGALTPANYAFEEGAEADGLLTLAVKPRRKDVLLIDGSIFLRPEDGELMRIEGRLSKAPSFWARQVQIVRWYKRIAGVRMPVALESTSNIRIAGRSTFRMTYEYETLNGQRVGNPEPRLALAEQTAQR